MEVVNQQSIKTHTPQIEIYVYRSSFLNTSIYNSLVEKEHNDLSTTFSIPMGMKLTPQEKLKSP